MERTERSSSGNSQKFGALLDNRFERALHDRTDGLEFDRLILPFRQTFPLASRDLCVTLPRDGTPVGALDPRR